MGFEFQKLDLKGAYLIKDFFVGDNRGGFTKTFEKDIFGDAGIDFSLNETFISRSTENVIRGLHFQKNQPQAKLVSVVSGAVWDVIVDLRIESPTFKEWRAKVLSADNHLSFYIPKGFAHGFASLQDNTLMLYQCEGKYDSETDSGIIYNDKDIGIEWPIDERIAIHSERDLKLEMLEEYLKSPMKY